MIDVVERIGRRAGGRILVTRDGGFIGIITATDLARWLDRAELLKRES
jgi:CBS domain-containing protein